VREIYKEGESWFKVEREQPRVRRERTDLGQDDNDLSLLSLLVLSDEQLLQPRAPESQRIPGVDNLEKNVGLLQSSLERGKLRVEEQGSSRDLLIVLLNLDLHLGVGVLIVLDGSGLGGLGLDSSSSESVDSERVVLLVLLKDRLGDVGSLVGSSSLLLHSNLLLLVLSTGREQGKR